MYKNAKTGKGWHGFRDQGSVIVWDDLPQNLAGRLLESINFRADGGCWEWTGSKTHGYGQISYDGKKVRVHRLTWMLANKKNLKKGQHVCHTCDNPGCVNPAHLFEGTAKDNSQDRSKKHYKKTVETEDLPVKSILNVRSAHNRGEQHWVIAERHNISPSQVHDIVTREDWPWLL
jgi:hypothetical protein